MHNISIHHDGHGNCPARYGQLRIKWCNDNITGHWYSISPRTITGNIGIEYNLNYEFWFEEESDAMAFKLRWL